MNGSDGYRLIEKKGLQVLRVAQDDERVSVEES